MKLNFKKQNTHTKTKTKEYINLIKELNVCLYIDSILNVFKQSNRKE